MQNILKNMNGTSLCSVLAITAASVAYSASPAFATSPSEIYVHAKEFHDNGMPNKRGGASIEGCSDDGTCQDDTAISRGQAWRKVCKMIGGEAGDPGLNSTPGNTKIYLFINSREGGKHVGSPIAGDKCCTGPNTGSGPKYTPKDPMPPECNGIKPKKGKMADIESYESEVLGVYENSFDLIGD